MPNERKAAELALRALSDAEVAAARGKPAEAEIDYRRALEVWPHDARALAGMVRVSIALGRYDEAVEWDDRARGFEARHLRDLSMTERCQLWLDAAETAMAGVVDSDALDVRQAGADRASALLARIEGESACAPLAASAGRVRAQTLWVAADAAHAADDLDLELEALDQAVEADPARVDVELRLGRARLDRGQRRAAVAGLADALERHPDSAPLELLMLEALGVPEPVFRDSD